MFAVAGRVEQAHEGKLLGVLDRLKHTSALGANAVLLPCPMPWEEGLGVQICPKFLLPTQLSVLFSLTLWADMLRAIGLQPMEEKCDWSL
jgi:hypothetical protein